MLEQKKTNSKTPVNRPIKTNGSFIRLIANTFSLNIFLFLLKNIDCGYSLEPPRRGGSNEYSQSMF